MSNVYWWCETTPVKLDIPILVSSVMYKTQMLKPYKMQSEFG